VAGHGGDEISSVSVRLGIVGLGQLALQRARRRDLAELALENRGEREAPPLAA
jgi:hypothetical protein